MFKFERVYLSCPSSDFNDVDHDFRIKVIYSKTQPKLDFGIKIIESEIQRNFENQTTGLCSVVYQTSGVFFWYTRYIKFVASRRAIVRNKASLFESRTVKNHFALPTFKDSCKKNASVVRWIWVKNECIQPNMACNM